MSYVTKYGSFWGMIPQTSGTVYWVAPAASYTVEGRSYSASDNNDGLSPERALLTLDRAFSLVTASVGDVVVLLPGAHSWSASVAWDIAGITVTGLPSGRGNMARMRTSVTTSASDQIMNITAANAELAYVHVIPVTAQVGVDWNGSADGLYIHDCSADQVTPAASTSTISFSPSASGADNVVLENIYVRNQDAQGPGIRLTNAGNTTLLNCVFRHSGTTAWADAVLSTTGTGHVVMIDCKWLAPSGAVITDPIDWTGQTDDNTLGVYGTGTIFSESVGVVNASADQDIESNYYAGLGKAILSGGGTANPIVLNAG